RYVETKSRCSTYRKESNMANIQPNRFVLQSSDGKTKVDYESTSFVGQPTLNLTQPPGHPIRHFAGSQIRRVNTENRAFGRSGGKHPDGDENEREAKVA